MFLLKENEKPLDNIKENCGFASILKDVGVIGDSLSSGEFEVTNEKEKQHIMICMNILGHKY